MIELPECFVQVLLRDIKGNTVFQCSKITFWWLIFIFNVFNQSFKKTYAKSGTAVRCSKEYLFQNLREIGLF